VRDAIEISPLPTALTLVLTVRLCMHVHSSYRWVAIAENNPKP